MSDDQTEGLRLRPPDELEPGLRAERFVVDDNLAFYPADGLALEDLEDAKAKGWRVISRDEFFAAWRERA